MEMQIKFLNRVIIYTCSHKVTDILCIRGGGLCLRSCLTLIKAPPSPLVQDCNVLVICNKQYIDNKSVSPEFGNVVFIYTGSWDRFNFKFNFNQYFKLC